MHFLTGTRPPEMTAVSSDRLASGAPGQEAQEYPQMGPFWNDLFYAHTGDMYIGQVGAHVGISLIGTYHKFARFSDGEIDPGDSHFAGQKFFPKAKPCRVG